MQNQFPDEPGCLAAAGVILSHLCNPCHLFLIYVLISLKIEVVSMEVYKKSILEVRIFWTSFSIRMQLKSNWQLSRIGHQKKVLFNTKKKLILTRLAYTLISFRILLKT